jgi:hypothetical protein
MVKLGLAAAMSAALVVPAMAQYAKPMDLSVRAGIFLASGDGKKFEGQNWFTIGLEKKLKDIPSANPDYMAHWSVSLDYYGKGGFSNVPLLYNYVGRNSDFYYGVGAGVGFGRTQSAGSDSTLDFNYQLSLGRDLDFGGQPLFVELRYFGSGRTALSGFSVVGGIRF